MYVCLPLPKKPTENWKGQKRLVKTNPDAAANLGEFSFITGQFLDTNAEDQMQ